MLYRTEQQHERGKLHAIERIRKLLDENTFCEIGSRIHHHCSEFGMEEKRLPYDGVITGFGTIHGRQVAIYSQDFTVMGGTLGEMHGKKISRIIRLAIDSRCPIIGLNDSGGARIQEGINALGGYGDIFRLNTLASGYIPQISIILGPCAGGAVYSPGITDFVFMVDSIGHMFVTGPKVIKKVLYEDVDTETLGGARLHTETSGVAHFSSETETECFHQVKTLLQYLPQYWNEHKSFNTKSDKVLSRKRKTDALEIEKVVPENSRHSYDVREIINKVFDINSFFEISERFAMNIVIGFARLNGDVIGVIANQPSVLAGVLDCNASDKAARFVRFCDAFNIPLVTIVDVPGFMPGVEQEEMGIIRHGAKILYAYAEASVPKITVIIRKAFGGAYIAMCSKQLGADLVFAWPKSELAVMGAEGAVDVLYRKLIRSSKNPEIIKKQKEEEYAKAFMNPNFAAEYGVIDEVIEPAETRAVLIRSLRQIATKDTPQIVKKHGNIPL